VTRSLGRLKLGSPVYFGFAEGLRLPFWTAVPSEGRLLGWVISIFCPVIVGRHFFYREIDGYCTDMNGLQWELEFISTPKLG
jgi:hypothetical protein